MAKVEKWAIIKSSVASEGAQALDYENHDRACELYSHYMSGYTEEEIVSFFNLEVEEVRKDLQHIKSTLPVRTLIAHENDRQRIIVQRNNGIVYEKLLSRSLNMEPLDFLKMGISPAGILREYREATGMTQRPEPLIQVNTQQNFLNGSRANGQGLTSAEDVIRRVLEQMDLQEQQTIAAEVREVDESIEQDDPADPEESPQDN